MKPIIAISMGDYNGIGPEVILKFLSGRTERDTTPLVLGSRSVFAYYADRLGIGVDFTEVQNVQLVKPDGQAYLLNVAGSEPVLPRPGELHQDAGRESIRAIETGISLCMNQAASALVTAPISKEAIHLAGYPYPGHTELLVERTGTKRHLMLMVSGSLRVGLLTTHISLGKVPKYITRDRISEMLRFYHQILQQEFGIENPRIGVLGLNPHAGDGGVTGREEIEIIEPAIHRAREDGVTAEGPFAADGFFGSRSYTGYDGILAMYHDQGLIPFKTLSFGSGVNVTAGLPIIRTSPDHGTAFAIAGEGVASPDSFRAAFELSAFLVRQRLRQDQSHTES